MASRLLLKHPLRYPGSSIIFRHRAVPPFSGSGGGGGGGGGSEVACKLGSRASASWPRSGHLLRMDSRHREGGKRSLAVDAIAQAATAAAKEDDMVYRKTIYDHEDWNRHRCNRRHMRHMLAIATSRVVAGLLPPVVRLTMVASVIVLYNIFLTGYFPCVGILHVSSLPFQLAAPALALLLVFRTNASYGRYDEARKSWATIASRSRDMARQAVTFFRHPADASLLHHLLQHLIALPYCVKDHLTREDDLRKELTDIVKVEDDDLTAIMSSTHRPNYVLQAMSYIVHSSRISDMQKAVLDSNIVSLQDQVVGCERLFTTPIPLCYTRLTSRILVVWHLLLPLALWDQCTWITIPATFLSAAALFCIEEVIRHFNSML
ncbi:hypothetical protein KP509_35G069400 [Ceratopteris richardii]|uniref:Uncharacterized protein n=1 Tax=Ceratopteris richardii TaxID=49495 RepID=A0A8T2QHQ4_CERRI|nr:hypothetical protein KP509_35G069400 [Ceratopteris richardii]